jgi:AcrR family transcriptional regulator
MPPTSRSSPRKRADAQRNRDRILEVAAEAFAADPDTSLNTIAKRAAIGPGTLYRHFPTREDLVLEIYGREVERLSGTVDALLDELSPIDALRTWFERLATYVRLKHGLGDALNTAAARQTIDATYAPVLAAIRQLLDAGAAAGVLRADLDAGDVLLLLSCLWRVPPGNAGQDQARRLLDTAINALRTQPTAPAH